MATKKKATTKKPARVLKSKPSAPKIPPQDYYYTALTWSSTNMGGGTVSRIHNQMQGTVLSLFQAANIIQEYMERQGAKNVVVVLNNFQKITRAEAELYEKEVAADFEVRKAQAIAEAEAIQAAAEKMAADTAVGTEAKEVLPEVAEEVVENVLPMHAESSAEAVAE